MDVSSDLRDDKEDTLKLLAILIVALAFAASANASSVVPISMHDPGCHSFYVGGKYLKTLSVKGEMTFINEDENTLIFKGPGGIKLVKVGKSLSLSRKGVYHITMVGQAPDDNHLKLTIK